jgi:fructosamine-3-kinase
VTLQPGASAATRVGGGDINEAYRVVLPDGRAAFVKTRPDAAPGEYAAEAAGLQWLAEPGALRTPAVLEVGEDFLALEWVPPGRLDEAGVEELGAGLAATHAAGAPAFGAACAAAVSGFGSLRLANEPTDDWPTFYAERRLRPLARIARDQSALSSTGVEAVERMCDRMAALVGQRDGGRPRQAVARRPVRLRRASEVDLAMLRLFGAPSERVFAAYEEVAPLAAGWHERVELYQLLPLLVHALLFGGSYRGAAERVANRYA